MFTGIITDVGRIVSAEQRGDLRLQVTCAYDMAGVDLGASIACSGVCLTVVDKGADWFAVDLSAETVRRTASDLWREGGALNLERSLRLGDELGGHIVTGHVDGVAEVVSVERVGDSLVVEIDAPSDISGYIAAKGSVALDGVSLTVNTVSGTCFGINLIPHTASRTTFGDMQAGRRLNVEIDILARYIGRMVEMRG
jgi:riboflavin synthase